MKICQRLTFVLLVFYPVASSAQTYKLSSPNKRIAATILVSESIIWSVKYDQEPILLPSRMSMIFADGRHPGLKPKVIKALTSSSDAVIISPVPVKNRLIKDNFNELKIQFKGNYGIIFRAYNDGIAYRFTTAFPDSVSVNNETAEFNFAGNFQTAWPVDEPFNFAALRYYV